MSHFELVYFLEPLKTDVSQSTYVKFWDFATSEVEIPQKQINICNFLILVKIFLETMGHFQNRLCPAAVCIKNKLPSSYFRFPLKTHEKLHPSD
jgi:hypothetical protein